jgi:hypothetical protein
MIAIVATSLVLLLSFAIIQWLAAVPLLRTLSSSIDCWADSVQGKEAEHLR